jgi:hypothetical protein
MRCVQRQGQDLAVIETSTPNCSVPITTRRWLSVAPGSVSTELITQSSGVNRVQFDPEVEVFHRPSVVAAYTMAGAAGSCKMACVRRAEYGMPWIFLQPAALSSLK